MEKVKGKKTLVTKDSRIGKRTAISKGSNELCQGAARRVCYVRFGLRPARKPSAERNGFLVFAFPAMNRWAFLVRPAERDWILEA
jgi:hypothetical protein